MKPAIGSANTFGWVIAESQRAHDVASVRRRRRRRDEAVGGASLAQQIHRLIEIEPAGR